ncbi:response regulator [Paenibacillus sp. GCM10027626]|uniref:response regulator transcription factor n=1 Tax=Paenibacillus sp. GCM10027626 TaxID=3273411 RepID=UPI003641F0FF
MYRVLIVDDERHVLDWIYELLADLPEPELDLYKAGTVTEALSWLHRSRMDIVVSDISMPGMTGLELHQKIREQWPDCKVIFLTGYTDFEYAYQAVKNDAVGYILKTEDDDVIVETVLKAVRMIEESARTGQWRQQAEAQLSAALPLLRNDYLTALLKGEPSTAQSRERQFRELEIGLDPVRPVMLIMAGEDSGRRGALDKSAWLHAVAMITDGLGSRYRGVVHVTMDGLLHWLVQAEEPGAVSAVVMMEILDRAQASCSESLGLHLSFVLSDDMAVWEELSGKQELMKQGLVRRIVYSRGFVLTESGLVKEPYAEGGRTEGMRLERSKLEALRTCLDKGERQRFLQELEEVGVQAESKGGELRDSTDLESFYQLSLLLLAAINRFDMQQLSGNVLVIDRLTRSEQHRTWEAALAFFRETAAQIFDLLEQRQATGDFNVIRYVQEYMDDHLHEGISLVELAEAVYFNPSYLSRLFKEVTGTSITAYLASRRLDRAIAMLQENRKVGEIAAAVGIESPAYFSRFFKKMTGRTPQEYREEVILANRS